MAKNVVGIGEVLWDVFPDRALLGGAPANFACHVASLGCRSFLVSAIGNDELGQKAEDELRSRNVATDFLQQRSEVATGRVIVSVDENGQPAYEIRPNSAWDCLAWDEALATLASECDAVCFGTLGQRSKQSRETIGRFLKATGRKSLRVLDVNLRQQFYGANLILDSLALANVLKLNEQELAVLIESAGIKVATVEDQLRRLASQFELKLVALTAGAKGATLFADGQISQYSDAGCVDVRDSVGAGDAFLAVVVLGLLDAWPLDKINELANQVAAYVCTQAGATPELPPQLLNKIKSI